MLMLTSNFKYIFYKSLVCHGDATEVVQMIADGSF